MARSFANITGTAMKTANGKSDSRRRLMMAVRAATKRLALADDDRKAIQLEVTGQASMADMNAHQLGLVLDRLNRDQVDRGLGGSNTRPHISKIKALWWTLYWLGANQCPDDNVLDAFVQRQTGISALRFVDYRSSPKIIEALKAMITRAGVLPLSAERLARAAALYPGTSLQQLERHDVVTAIWDQGRDAGLFNGASPYLYLTRSLKLQTGFMGWGTRDLDECIRHLGKAWRRHLYKGSDGAQ